MKEHPEYTVAEWAMFLQVSRSGYYRWLGAFEETDRKDKAEKEEVRKIWEEGEGTYGPDRICGIIRKRGGHMGREKAARHMEEMGLTSCHNQHRNRSLTNSKKARGEGFENLMRKETPLMPRVAVASDITYLRSGEGFEYLCIIKDIVSGEILGSHAAARMTKELVIKAFTSMLGRYRLEEGCIFHSDRGSQYTSKAFQALVKQCGFRQSFSRVGMPGDNAWSESFFATMKKERFHWWYYETREQVRAAAFEYIEVFYNNRRVQKRLGYLSPRDYYQSLQSRSLSLVA
jgi:putative transposase